MAESDLRVLNDLSPSPSGWVEAVVADFDEFLKDHASCEKKASGMAMAVASHYPDQPRLLQAMVDLAVEELNHYREVIRLLMARGVVPGADRKDPYINALNQHVRRGAEHFLLDRLLMGAVVERRGAERFALLAARLLDTTAAANNATRQLAKFYRSIAASEQRHWTLFVELAKSHCDADAVVPRCNELIAIEAEVMYQQPLRPALH